MTARMVPISEAAFLNPRYSAATANGRKTVAFLPMAGLSERGFIASAEERSISDVSHGYTYFEEGDILLAKITPCLENGKAAIVCNLPHRIGFGSTEFHVLRPRKGVDARFLFYMIWNPLFRHEASRNMTGSAGQKRVPADFVSNYKIPLPSLAEQRRIAAILDKGYSIRRKREEGIRLTDELLRSAFLEVYGDPVANPKGWNVEQLGDAIMFIGGSQPPKETFRSEPKAGYIRLVQIRDFKTDKYQTYIPKELARRSFEKDDVMIARYGPPVFQILRGLSGSYNVALMKAQPTDKTTKDFIFYLLQTPAIHDTVVDNSSRTAGQSGVNLDLLNNLDVPIPPISVQQAIGGVMRRVEKTKAVREQAFRESQQLFNCLVQRAFWGEL